MSHLLAEDLLLLCWDDVKGRLSSKCRATLPVGIGGALILDLIMTEAVVINGKRVEPTGHNPDKEVLAEALLEVHNMRPWPSIYETVRTLGTPIWLERIHKCLEDSGVLLTERRNLLWLFPVVRSTIVNPQSTNAARKAVASVLAGKLEPRELPLCDVVLAALISAINAVDVFVSKPEQTQGYERVAKLIGDQRVYQAVIDVIVERFEEVQLEAVVASLGGTLVSSNFDSDDDSY